MCAELISLAHVGLIEERARAVALHNGRSMDCLRFNADIAGYAAALRRQEQQLYAVFYEDAYPFAVMLFALLHAGKQVFIPGNNRPATADYLLSQGCRLLGEWPGQETPPLFEVQRAPDLKPLDLAQARLNLFTSGSSGQPKTIAKTLKQLQREVEVLEQQWGELLGRAAAVATVSHQHIYGLLFRLLWPLASGRCFHSRLYLSPEPMLKAVASSPAYWVASPAQLKRLDDLTDWNAISRLTAIFSSGGSLPDQAARQIEQRAGRRVVEIYGSSETGGIGWRHTALDKSWIPFADIRLSNDGQGRCRLYSPFLPGPEPCWLDDGIELHSDGRFTLAGRLDRIVKVEEKRLSLAELEQALRESEWVAECHCLLLTGGRQRVAAAVGLSASGRQALAQMGRPAMIRQLRRQLMRTFENVVLPRKWLFTNHLPLTLLGKTDTVLLQELMQLDVRKFPQLLYCRFDHHTVRLELRVRPEQIYFQGHFPGQPILPGVAQLAWVERYGTIFFAVNQPFLTMEAVKFKKIIQPEALLTMTLEWNAVNGKLYFDLNSAVDSHSSGRMVYGTRP